MHEITLDSSEQTLLALNATPGEADETVQMAAAAKLYELGRLSSGAAAELAGVPRTLFLTKLADYGVATFQLSEQELRGEMSVALGYR